MQGQQGITGPSGAQGVQGQQGVTGPTGQNDGDFEDFFVVGGTGVTNGTGQYAFPDRTAFGPVSPAAIEAKVHVARTAETNTDPTLLVREGSSGVTLSDAANADIAIFESNVGPSGPVADNPMGVTFLSGENSNQRVTFGRPGTTGPSGLTNAAAGAIEYDHRGDDDTDPEVLRDKPAAMRFMTINGSGVLTERMIIEEGSGLVGINTRSRNGPKSRLDVNGTIGGTKFRDHVQTEWGVDFGTNASGSSSAGGMARALGVGLYLPEAWFHVRGTDQFPGPLIQVETHKDLPQDHIPTATATTRLWFTHDGLLGVNTGTSASAMFHAQGINGNDLARLDTSGGSTVFQVDSTGKVGIGNVVGTSGRTETVQIFGNGYCSGCVSGTWVDVSDRRLKTGISSLDGALGTLRRLRPVSYFYSSDYISEAPGTPAFRQHGFVAQEFQQVFPDYVTEGPDGFLGLSSGGLTAYTVKGIQELTDIVEEQERVIEDQQRQIDELKAMMQRLLDDEQ